jgi:hypothetical protein
VTPAWPTIPSITLYSTSSMIARAVGLLNFGEHSLHHLLLLGPVGDVGKGKVTASRVACAVRGGRKRGGGGLDQDLELLAGDVRIDPVAKSLLLPLEPGLQTRRVKVAFFRPVKETAGTA